MIAACLVIFAVCFVAMLSAVFALRSINDTADLANRKAQRALIQQTLTREKVCSETANQRVACRALFERLIRSISRDQQLRLACGALYVLRDAALTPVAKANCPRHPRAP